MTFVKKITDKLSNLLASSSRGTKQSIKRGIRDCFVPRNDAFLKLDINFNVLSRLSINLLIKKWGSNKMIIHRNMLVRNLSILFFIMCFQIDVQAQKIRYKDVYQKFVKKDYDGAYSLLKYIAKIDTLNTSANLYLGIICYNKGKTLDPLQQNSPAQKFCDSAVFYLNRAAKQVTEKEIRKNDDYYTVYTYNKIDTTKKVTNRDSILRRVKSDIAFKIKDAAHHRDKIKEIYHHFNKAVDLYGKCASKYGRLTKKFPSVKEICLLSDEALEKGLIEMATDFDSSVVNLEAYKKAIKRYPIKGYDQTYTFEKIETYRLDGLGRPDFLSKSFVLWKYGEWAKEVSKMISTDIKFIREKMVFYDEMYNNLLEKIDHRSVGYDSTVLVQPNKKLYGLLNKYDYNSVMIKLLDYKQKKHDYYVGYLSKFNSLENTNASNFEPKASFFFGQISKINAVDTFIQKLQATNFTKESTKYADFISKRFVDTKGLVNYLEEEKTFVKRNKSETNFRMLSLMYGQLMKFSDSTIYIYHEAYQIPFFQSFEYGKSNVKTTFITEDNKGNTFLCGYIKAGEGTNAFVCKLNEIKQVAWFKSIPVKPENKPGLIMEFASVCEPVKGGCIVILNSKSGTGIKNTAIQYDETGKEVFNRHLNAGSVARKLIYDEINDNILIVVKGENPEDYSNVEEVLLFSCLDAAGNVKWTHKFNLIGNVADLNKITDGYLISCNFASISTGSNTILSKAGTSIGKTNVFFLKVNSAGQIAKYETISSITPVYSIGTVKLNSNNINILGFKSDLAKDWRYKKFEGANNKLQQVVTSNLEMR